MGLNNKVFKLIAKCEGSGKALSAGYPDCLVTKDVITEILGKEIPIDPLHETIEKNHGFVGARDAIAVFGALGYELDVIDIIAVRGMERIVDLNHPADLGSYDLVLDHGTLEHCFNIGQAAINLASAVKVGGHIVQHLPMNMFNHGFYNLNPNWFWNFYEQNGFEILYIDSYPAHNRFVNIPENTQISMVAVRKTDERIAFPTQQRYKA